MASRIGAPDATTVLVDLGIPQQTLIDDAMAAMVSGEIEVAVVVGAEAKARAARAAHGQRTRADRAGIADAVAPGRTQADASETDQGGARPDLHQQPTGDVVDPAEIEAGLWAPVEQYALIESALCGAEGVRASDMGEAVSQLWARFNQVAGGNPDAAFPEPMSAEELSRFSSGNRPLAFPYAKWHASQWTVDQVERAMGPGLVGASLTVDGNVATT